MPRDLMRLKWNTERRLRTDANAIVKRDVPIRITYSVGRVALKGQQVQEG
jgi:hypothetical protein